MVRTPLWGPCLAVAVSLLVAAPSPGQVAPAFRNTIDTVSPNWMGPVFELSKDYPTTLPADPKPWKAFDFKTQQKEYLQAVLAYCLEGNEAVQWKVQDNAVRKWYHAPGLLGRASGNNAASGREFIRGLTRERTSPAKELDPKLQTKRVTNWAVGFYNPIGAVTIGKVWANPKAPNTTNVKFEDGAVGFKLLFTSATEAQVPFLANSLKWQANIDLVDLVPPSSARQPRDVLLLQVDVAVRDDRADDTTGWVFGTFMYQNDAPGTTPFQRLVPVGLMWGNDPNLAKGATPVQTWLNTNGMPPTKSPHFGWANRLNGPVDNPRSSCLSCHARAAVPMGQMAAAQNENPDDPAKKFFTNTKAGEVYEGAPAGTRSLDYSLQLGVGVRLFPGKKSAAGPPSDVEDTSKFRAGEPEAASEVPAPGKDEKPPDQPGKDEKAPAEAAAGETNWLLWVGLGVFVVLMVIIYLLVRSKRP